MLVGILVELHVTCRCRTEVPANGVVEAVACHSCGKQVALPEEFWKARFDKDDFEPLLLKPGKSDASPVRSISGMETYLRYALELPLCVGCRKPLDLTAVGDEIECGCGKTNRVRKADELSKLIDTRAVMIVGETTRVVEKVKRAVVFACMKCGGTLEVDGSARTIPCTYCTASNYLPDGVWEVIYPVPQLEPFYVVAEYSEDQLREARWADFDTRVKDAAEGMLTPELYGQLSHDDDSGVREALASNPAIGAALIAKLLEDDEDDVRAAAAANRAAPVAELEKLARRETQYNVLTALIARPELPASVVEALAASKHHESRIHAIEHPALPVALLRTLEKDEDDRVKRRAKERIAELQKSGVEVPGGGWLSRLFG
jgi:hypothetical protein